MLTWRSAFGLPVEIREDTRFFASIARFHAWANERTRYRMEFFYREMRRETGLLMEGDEPAGGRWNYHVENRRKLPRDRLPPERRRFWPDEITKDVLDLVAQRFGDHFGELSPFEWAVTRRDALVALDGGLLASKPYASSGAYIDRMSNFCKTCAYDVKAKSGPTACPFNYLYWAFLIRNAQTLRGTQRMAMPYRTLAGWDEGRKASITAEAAAFLDALPVEPDASI